MVLFNAAVVYLHKDPLGNGISNQHFFPPALQKYYFKDRKTSFKLILLIHGSGNKWHPSTGHMHTANI